MINKISTKFKHFFKSRYENPELACIDPAYAYKHAIIKGLKRFELGEAIIATSAEFSMLYAYNITGKRFELGEPAIAKHAEHAYQYSVLILNSRFYLYEENLANNTCDYINSVYVEAYYGLYKEYFKL